MLVNNQQNDILQSFSIQASIIFTNSTEVDIMSLLTYHQMNLMKKLKNGWVEGSVQDFLELSEAEASYVETRIALGRRLREERARKHLTQTELATALQTSQSRIAKMEKADPSVSLDLVIQALFKLGLSRRQLATAI